MNVETGSPVVRGSRRLPADPTLRRLLDNCVIIDCETTGLDPLTDRIIEIGAVRVRAGRPVAVFHRLVDPARKVPAVTTLTGISDATLRAARPSHEAIEDLLGFSAHSPLVGHNVSFDLAFLHAAMDPGSAALWSPESVCTARTAREVIPRHTVGRYRLATLSSVLGLAHSPRHRSLDDAFTTLDLLRYLAGAPRPAEVPR